MPQIGADFDLEIERNTNASGAEKLTLSKLPAPSGDDQLKLAGTIAVATSPPIDPLAHGFRFILTNSAGVVLAELVAAAEPSWSVNGAGTSWKYRDRFASSGIVDAKVKTTKTAGTLRVQLKARGLALGAAPAATPPVASTRSGC